MKSFVSKTVDLLFLQVFGKLNFSNILLIFLFNEEVLANSFQAIDFNDFVGVLS